VTATLIDKFDAAGISVSPHHTAMQAGMTAADTVNVKHRGLIDFKVFQGPMFKHRNVPKKFSNYQKRSGARPGGLECAEADR
jgi:hypothetical protein